MRENLEGSLLANDSNGQAEHPESEKKTKPGPKPAKLQVPCKSDETETCD